MYDVSHHTLKILNIMNQEQIHFYQFFYMQPYGFI